MMKYIFCLLFSFGLYNFNLNKVFIILNLLMLMMILKVNLFNALWSEMCMEFSVDFYSFYLVILSLFITSLMLMIKMKKESKMIIMILLMILVLSFLTFNLMVFYFLFEVSLLPIFLLIKFDGYSFERLESILYMFFFTMLSSIPFLVILLMVYEKCLTFLYFVMEVNSLDLHLVIFFMMLLVFLVKMPMFFVHIWLPKAHVEAPVYGSMILAGVLLKLGGYGLLRMSQLFFIPMVECNNYLISTSLIGSILLSLFCLIQVDMKMLVAYSSVVHMSLVISSLSSVSKIGFVGSYLMMIGHGLCSSGLFYIVNLSYKRMSSRLMFLNKGLMVMNSTLSMWWFLFCVGNFSAPITLSLIGEVLMLMSLISLDWVMIFYLIFSCFFGASYSLYLYSFTQHGEMNFLMNKFKEFKMKEFLILFLHWVPLNFLTFGLNLFMN